MTLAMGAFPTAHQTPMLMQISATMSVKVRNDTHA
jgi:hypothetical protein